MLIAGPVPDCAFGTRLCARVAYCTRSSLSIVGPIVEIKLGARRVLAIREVVGALHRHQAAADVGGDEVVEEHVAHRQAIAGVQLVIDLADRKLGVQAAWHIRRLGETERRLVRRRDRDDAEARQVALGVLVAAEEVRLVLDDRTAEVDGVDVDVGRRLALGCAALA